MKTMSGKFLTLSSIIGLTVLLAGCSTMCGAKKHHRAPAPKQTVEAVMFYQTYEEADVNRVAAKMYTRSSRGGESEMGTIKFAETDAGLKMEVDLKDLRPGKVYTMRVHQCKPCNSGMCCSNSAMPMTLPTLKIANAGRLQESFMIRGLTAQQLNNAKLYLERDGGYKAAWGTIGQAW